jgi:hypothetical protein
MENHPPRNRSVRAAGLIKSSRYKDDLRASVHGRMPRVWRRSADTPSRLQPRGRTPTVTHAERAEVDRDSAVRGAEGTGRRRRLLSTGRTERDLGGIDPHDPIGDDARHPIEASRGRPELVPAEPVELRSMRRILEPIRGRAVLDWLAHLWASSQEGDRALRRICHHVGMELGDVHDLLRPYLVERAHADPPRTGRSIRLREEQDRKTRERRAEGGAHDERNDDRSARLREHAAILGSSTRSCKSASSRESGTPTTKGFGGQSANYRKSGCRPSQAMARPPTRLRRPLDGIGLQGSSRANSSSAGSSATHVTEVTASWDRSLTEFTNTTLGVHRRIGFSACRCAWRRWSRVPDRRRSSSTR